MSGSGTVLAVAQSRGHPSVGIDLDPLAVLISRVWTTPIERERVQLAAERVLNRAKTIFSSLYAGDAYPRNADFETRKFLRYWFDDDARKQLTSLSTAIGRIRDCTVRDALWCSFSRLIITKQSGASLAMDLSHSRPHRKFKTAPAKPFANFLSAVGRVASNCVDGTHRRECSTAEVLEGDARNLQLRDRSIDLAITSPPYLNAIDYFRCSKFSLVWMGYTIDDIRRLRSTSVGAEIGIDPREDQEVQQVLSSLRLNPKLQGRQEAMLSRYIHDIQRCVGEISRVLDSEGKAVYVVGENTVRGTFIPNAMIVEILASAEGLRCTERRCRELPANRRYMPPPSTKSDVATLGNRMRREVILTFRKSQLSPSRASA